MTTNPVPVKTPEALTELSSRQRKLSQRHRTALLLVDGRRTEAQVRAMAEQAGAPSSCFDELVELGMIRYLVPTAPLDETPRLFLNQSDSEASLLPASLSLQPSLHDSVVGDEPAPTDTGALDDSQQTDGQDEAFDEARAILMRAVRTEAPVAGALTLLRLRRATSRDELTALLDEVESRIAKPFKGLWATQTLQRVKELLSTQMVA